MKISYLRSLTILLVLIFSFAIVTKNQNGLIENVNYVLAENDDDGDQEDYEEDEHEDREEEDDEDDDDYKKSSTSQVEYETVTEIITVTEPLETGSEIQTVQVSTVEPAFKMDSDGDKLVDAIDPHPDVPEFKLFTDSDNDSVADYYDKFPDEDDILRSILIDENSNGIIDSFESL